MSLRTVIDLEAPSAWPDELCNFLAKHEGTLHGWLCKPQTTRPSDYDAFVRAFRDFTAPYYLTGFHCTRLTEPEIWTILASGMQLPDVTMLTGRIDRLQRDGLIDEAFAEALRANHFAQEDQRSGRVWFCFFPPRRSGEWGIGDLLGCWGGEALYRGVDFDPRLKSIGTPCIIEADVRIDTLYHQPDDKMLNIWLRYRGLDREEPTDHEDCTTSPIPVQQIRRVIRFPDPAFVTLTSCEHWDEPLCAPDNP